MNFLIDKIKRYKFEFISFLITFFVSSIFIYFGGVKHSTDDSFILFRYIDNIISGNGFVYNIGEKILGATTPLFTLSGVLFKLVFGFLDIPTVVLLENVIFLSLSSIFFYKVCQYFFSKNVALVAVFVFAFNLSKIIPEGMETGLFILTLFAFIHYLLIGKNYISAVFLSFVLLTRPDAALIAVLAFIYWWKNYGFEKTIRYTFTSILVALPWLVFSTIYFDSFVPQSLMTKLHLSDMVNIPKVHAFKTQLASMSRTYVGKIFDPENLILQSIFNLTPFILLVYIGIKNKMNYKNWIVFAIPTLYFVVYSISNPVMWPWYISQMEPLWILLSFIGLSVIYEKIKGHYLKIFVTILILMGPFYFWTSGVFAQGPGSELYNMEVADHIKERMVPGDSVGINNIGVLGFYLKGVKIVDFFGLVNDYATSFYPVEGECVDMSRMYNIPPKIILFTVPDWVVVSGEELDPCFVKGDWFKKTYKKEDFTLDFGATIWRKIK